MATQKNIVFIPTHRRNDLPSPVTTKSVIPKWYKDLSPWIGDSPVISGYSSNSTVKQCVPFLDSLISGYVLTLHTDVQVTRHPEFTTASLTWMMPPDPLVLRDPAGGRGFPIPAGHDSDHWAWVANFGFSLPKGYSALVTHPLNRFDLPFTTTSGIMDSDMHWASGNLPFFLKSDFEGIIEAGTPIAQILPFKRESWTSEVDTSEETFRKADNMTFKARSVLNGFYKKNAWQRKQYD